MNSIILHGTIKDIEHSHDIDNISFSKAKLICKRDGSKEDVINLRFKSFSNRYTNNEEVTLLGNIRSYSYKTEDGNNKVVIYVFTYFDTVDSVECDNSATLDGRICKMNPLRHNKSGKDNVHFIIANNLVSKDNSKRLNSYIPCIAWGKIAKEIAELPVSTKICLHGQLHSREHKKVHPNGEVEFRVAHEFLVTSYEVM